MNKKSDAIALEFVRSKIKPQLLAAYSVVADLQYPIPDHQSFSTQVESLSKSQNAKDSLGLVAGVFEASDFPIQTVRGGLEKFHARFASVYGDPWLRPIPPKPVFVNYPSFGDSVVPPEVNVVRDYEARFGRRLWDSRGIPTNRVLECALAHYSASLAIGDTAVEAFFRGLRAGEMCQRNRACPVLPAVDA